METKRLIIRRFAESDAADLHAYLSLPETYRFEPGKPISLDEAKNMAKERETSDCFFAVALKGTGAVIGHLYFAEHEPPEEGTWELGYIFNPAYMNQGYCTEAAGMILEYAFGTRGARRVVAGCNALNPASWRVLEKIGMHRVGESLNARGGTSFHYATCEAGASEPNHIPRQE